MAQFQENAPTDRRTEYGWKDRKTDRGMEGQTEPIL